jgi:hypothetical protein
VYWGDDDDPPQTADSIERLLELAAAAGDDIGGVGSTGALWDWSTGKIQRIPDDDLSGVIDVDVIGGNQQLIIRSEAVKKAGLPDTRLFFGFEELEYCLRLRVAGYRLVVNGEVMRECRARAGRLNLAAPSRLRDCYPYNAMWRGYYSTRNYIFAMNRTFRRPDLARYEALKAVGRACLSWRRGPRVGAAVTMLQMRGIIDGVFGHMGRTVTPAPKYKTSAAASPEGAGA